MTGSGDLTCGITDIEKGKLIYRGLEHENSVRAVKSCKYNSSLFLTGGRDGKLIVWDTRDTTSKTNQIKDETIITPIIIEKSNAGNEL